MGGSWSWSWSSSRRKLLSGGRSFLRWRRQQLCKGADDRESARLLSECLPSLCSLDDPVLDLKGLQTSVARMPVTRSITSTPVRGVKRSLATPATPVSPTPRPKRAKKQPLPSTDVAPPTPASSHQDVPTSVVPAPAEAILPEEPAGPVPLTFDIAAAKSHLSALDPRFSSLFAQLPCKPFEGEDLERAMNPFRSLATSILGQQVSWLAAKAITYRFCRLFFPDLPEKLEWASFAVVLL